MPDGSYRYSAFFTPAAGAGTIKLNVASDGATISYAGDVTKGIFAWGLQFSPANGWLATTPAGYPYVSTTSTTRTILAPMSIARTRWPTFILRVTPRLAPRSRRLSRGSAIASPRRRRVTLRNRWPSRVSDERF